MGEIAKEKNEDTCYFIDIDNRGVITNIFSGVILFLMFYMYAQAFFWVQSLIIIWLLIFLLILSAIGLFKLKKWGRNIFIVFTIIMNSPMVLLFSKLLLYDKSPLFFFIAASLITFIIFFISYFLKPSTRELFSDKENYRRSR